MLQDYSEIYNHEGFLRLNPAQQNEIQKAVDLRIDLNKIEWLLNSKLNLEQLDRAIMLFLDGLSVEKVEFLILFDLTPTMLAKMAKSLKKYKDSDIKLISEKIMEFYKDQIQFIMALLYKGTDFDDVKPFVSGKYDKLQMTEISEGIKNGLLLEQLKIYANNNLSAGSMYQIREGIENGLTPAQINFYTNAKFETYQMYQLRLGFEAGLSFEEVGLYANPEYSGDRMQSIREKILENKRSH